MPHSWLVRSVEAGVSLHLSLETYFSVHSHIQDIFSQFQEEFSIFRKFIDNRIPLGTGLGDPAVISNFQKNEYVLRLAVHMYSYIADFEPIGHNTERR